MATDDNTLMTAEQRKSAGRQRGLVRMRQLASERLAQRQAIAAQILSELGRAPTTLDKIAANNLAALHVRADQLEAMGKNADAVRQQITQAQRASGFKPEPAATKPQRQSIREMLAARGATSRPIRNRARPQQDSKLLTHL